MSEQITTVSFIHSRCLTEEYFNHNLDRTETNRWKWKQIAEMFAWINITKSYPVADEVWCNFGIQPGISIEKKGFRNNNISLMD